MDDQLLLELSLAMVAALMWVDLANANVSSLITCHKGTVAWHIGEWYGLGGGGVSSFLVVIKKPALKQK